MSAITFFVKDDSANAPLADVLLDAKSVNGNWLGLTGPDGRFVADLAAGHYDVNFSKTGYVTEHRPCDLAAPGTITVGMQPGTDPPDTHPPIPPPIGGTLPRLSVSGYDFVADGQRKKIRGTTELCLGELYERGLDGRIGADAVRAVLRDRRSVGADCVRFLCQHQYRGPWMMTAAGVRALVDLSESEGFYSMPCILADCWQGVSELQARVADVANALHGSASMPQLGNEWDKNGFNPSDFSKPVGGPWAHASTTEGYQGWGMVLPPWDHAWYSGQRAPVGKGILAYCGIEAQYGVAFVPCGAGEGMKPGINSSDPADFRRAGDVATNGGFFHTIAGTSENERLFNDLERACGLAFFGALR